MVDLDFEFSIIMESSIIEHSHLCSFVIESEIISVVWCVQ